MCQLASAGMQQRRRNDQEKFEKSDGIRLYDFTTLRLYCVGACRISTREKQEVSSGEPLFLLSPWLGRIDKTSPTF